MARLAFDVDLASHDDLLRGQVVTTWARVVVWAGTEADGALAACQLAMATRTGMMATGVTMIEWE